VRAHLQAEPAFGDRCLRFIENHDEPRAAAIFSPDIHRAAAVVALLAPGLRLVHDGQIEGRRSRMSVHLGRRAVEPIDHDLGAFYDRLLAALARPEAHDGRWTLWPSSHDQLIVSTWDTGAARLLVVVNYGASPARGTAVIRLPDLGGRRWALVDLLGDARYERDGDDLMGPGMTWDLRAWGHQVLAMHSL
jgi:hypothetical protein